MDPEPLAAPVIKAKVKLPPRYFEVFPGRDGQFYWHEVSRHNKKVTNIGGEGFPKRGNASRSITSMLKAHGATIAPTILQLQARPEYAYK